MKVRMIDAMTIAEKEQLGQKNRQITYVQTGSFSKYATKKTTLP